jgi:hypothetical protein
MKKLFLLIIVLALGFALMSCDDDNDTAISRDKVFVPNSSLIDDLSSQVKDVFKD